MSVADPAPAAPADRRDRSPSLRLAPAPDNRRRSERRPYVIEAFLSSPTAAENEPRLEATAVNLSRHGIAFDLDRPLPTGCFYVIEVGMGDQRLVTEARIIFCKPAEQGIWNVGAEFC